MTSQSPDASPRGSNTEPARPAVSGLRVLRGFTRGVVGGLIATVLMTLYRFPVFRALPPTADFWATYVGDGDPKSYLGTGLVLHFLYGGVAGGVFGAAIDALDLQLEREGGLGVIALSLAYGLALSGFGTRFVFRRLLAEELEPDEAVIFHVGHVIYGLTLGTWLNFSEPSGEVYE